MMLGSLSLLVGCWGSLFGGSTPGVVWLKAGPTAWFKAAPPPPKAETAVEPPEVKFVQVHPAMKEPGQFIRSRSQGRAVVLIHGYWLHLKKERVNRAIFKDWQGKKSALVNTLGKDADVFAFAYGQTVSVEEIADLRPLTEGIRRLRGLGYSQIVLVGHSAGGLVAREFVEDHPASGVTKVVQVCAPNGGSFYADIKLVPKNHQPFVSSLCKTSRDKCLRERAGKKVPAAVQFVCVITAEDLVVPCKCQWTPDLQDQGVPAVRINVGHRQVMRQTGAAQQLAEIIRRRETRWSMAQVAAARKELLKPKKTN
jgi:pimeloyl-ACP methyl ester carboxylesterase